MTRVFISVVTRVISWFFFSLSRSDKEDLFFLLFVCFYVIFFKKVLAFESFRFLKNVDDQEGFGARC